MKKLIPVPYQEDLAKNPILFPVILISLQVIFIILLAFHADYGREPLTKIYLASDTSTVRTIRTFPNGTTVIANYGVPISYGGIANLYSIFQNIHIMIFVGFGFLLTFFRRYG